MEPLVKKFVQILLPHPNKNIPQAYHGISMVQCPTELHGETMFSTIENPWEYPRISIGIPWIFMVNTMEFPWNFGILPCFCYIYPLGFPCISHGQHMGFPLGLLAIEKTWVLHEKPMDFHGQYNNFSKYGHAVPRKTYGSDHGFSWNTGRPNHGFTMSCHVIFFGFPWF